MAHYKDLFQILLVCCSFLVNIRGNTIHQQELSQCSNDYFSNFVNRFDCFPRGIANQESCVARGCCWVPLKPNSKEPWCFYPQYYKNYQLVNITQLDSHGLSLVYENVFRSPYPNDIEHLRVDVIHETDNRVHIKIYDSINKRYESPYPKISKNNQGTNNTKYSIEFGNFQSSNFGFAVKRKSSNTILFDTRNVGGFIFSDQFLQISAKLVSKYIYGFGEMSKPFLQKFDWTTLGQFAQDVPPRPFVNAYGSHPFYLSLEEDGKSHGVFLLNSNALDVTFQPTSAITYRTVGGVLDFYFFLGDKPSDVIEQYLQLIGTPNLPPYWSLGFHLSKYGIKNVQEAEQILDRNLKAGIPLETFYGDIDYMDNYLDFTYDKINYDKLPEFVNKLHSLELKFVPIIDPGIDTDRNNYAPFDEGMKEDIFIKNENGTLFRGKVWNPGNTAYPDFTHPKIYDYWSNQLKEFYKSIPFDGIWIDMNEPSNFAESICPSTKWDNPPYVPKKEDQKQHGLKSQTLCMSSKQYVGSHYDVHNLYGISQTEVTATILKDLFKKRPFVLSRSTFPGSGYYGNHWTGDVASDWDAMRQSVTDMMLFNLFGIPMVGADICGYYPNTTVELCARWSQLGSFYPFSRNHNAKFIVNHDPAAPDMGSIVTEAARKSLLLRYSLLPYLYTLFHKSNSYGETVVRPLFFEYPNDKNTFELDEQFMWGSALLIAPVLKEKATSVEVYFPQGVWYTYPHFERVNSPSDGLKKVFDAPITEVPPIFIREGYTIVTQTPDVTITKSRLNDFHIVSVLNSEGQSRGDIFWDDGYTLDKEDYNFIVLTTQKQCLQTKVERYDHDTEMNVDDIKIVGVNGKVQKVVLSVLETKKSLNFTHDEKLEILTIDTKAYSNSLFSFAASICWS